MKATTTLTTSFLLAAASALLAAPTFVGAQIAAAPLRQQKAVQRRRRNKSVRWVERDLKGNEGNAKPLKTNHRSNDHGQDHQKLVKRVTRHKEPKKAAATPPKEFLDVDVQLMPSQSMPLEEATAEEEVFKTMNVDSRDAGEDLPSSIEVTAEMGLGLELPPEDAGDDEMGLMSLSMAGVVKPTAAATTTAATTAATTTTTSKAAKSPGPNKPSDSGREKPSPTDSEGAVTDAGSLTASTVASTDSIEGEETPDEMVTIAGQQLPASSSSTRSQVLAVSAAAGACVAMW